jgi:Xaa-Pro aminopeptidase
LNRIYRDESALYHACGYGCDHAIYLKLGSEAYFITDGRYTVDAEANVHGAEVLTASDLPKEAAKRIAKSGIRKIMYDPKEWDVYTFERLKNRTKVAWKPRLLLSQKERIIKRPDEIELLEKAVAIGAVAFEEFAALIDVAGAELSEQKLYQAARAVLHGDAGRPLSFDPIVAIGSHAAKPHAHPEKKTYLKRGDLLLFDAGIRYKHYCSDRTRTVRVTKRFAFDYDQAFKDKKTQKAYDTVLKAHDRAIAKARSGMRACKVDAIARDVIERAGFGKYFVHSTGHGVGLDIHELPVISARSRTRIENGMVYTIEPGIYLPGKFGIRIEDMVVMEEGRARILTP